VDRLPRVDRGVEFGVGLDCDDALHVSTLSASAWVASMAFADLLGFVGGLFGAINLTDDLISLTFLR
jgi:hypothetical protein